MSSSFKKEFCIGALSRYYLEDLETKGTLHIQQGVEQPTVTYLSFIYKVFTLVVTGRKGFHTVL